MESKNQNDDIMGVKYTSWTKSTGEAEGCGVFLLCPLFPSKKNTFAVEHLQLFAVVQTLPCAKAC